MARLFETLESRTLLSASAATLTEDLKSLLSQELHVKADYTATQHQSSADLKTLSADLKRVNASSSDESILKTLESDTKSKLGKLNKDVNSWLGAVTKRSKAAIADAKALARKPGNAKLIAKLADDIAKMRSVDHSGRDAISADTASLDSTSSQDLTEIANAESGDATTQTDVATFKTTFAGIATTFQQDGTLVSGKIDTLVTDLNTP